MKAKTGAKVKRLSNMEAIINETKKNPLKVRFTKLFIDDTRIKVYIYILI
jgi:hypothetical protein